MDILSKTAVELAAALRRREMSAVELLEHTIERAQQVTPLLNPFALERYERARDLAKVADGHLARGDGGPLCGLPVTVKDSQFLAGVRCANGSRVLQDFVPQQSCAAVARLEEAGAIIFAKTTCPEFGLVGITASEMYGYTCNPWDPERTPGGSSGGAAVATATGLGALALGGDGGGSIRIPSAFCGVVGFKPSFGLVPREPCFPSWKSLVCYGPIARSVADARLLFASVLDPEQAAGRRVLDARCRRLPPLRGVRLAVSEDLGFAPLDRDVRDAFHLLLERLDAAGAELIDDNPGLPSSAQTWAISATYDTWVHQQASPYLHADLSELTQAILAFGSQFSEADYLAAQAERTRIHDAYRAMFERTGACALLTPTLGCEAFAHGRVSPERIGDTPIELPWLDWAGFLYDANLTGMPACAVPMGLGDEGLPLSVQVLGPVGEDACVLETAEQVETLVSWHDAHLDQSREAELKGVHTAPAVAGRPLRSMHRHARGHEQLPGGQTA